MSKEDKTLSELKKDLGLVVSKIYDLGHKSGREKTEEEALYQERRVDYLSRVEGFDEGFEKGRKIGQDEAWSLSRRILEGDFTALEYLGLKNAFQIDGDVGVEKRIIFKGSYADVAAKVAEWEEDKEKPKTREEAFFERFPSAKSDDGSPCACFNIVCNLYGVEGGCPVVNGERVCSCRKCWAMPYGGEFEASEATREEEK